MGRFPPLLWLLLLALLLLPTAAGRVLLDLAGGLLITLLALPVVLGGLGWIGWKVLQSRVRTCEACGLSTMTTDAQCPACGSPLPQEHLVHQRRKPLMIHCQQVMSLSISKLRM